MSTALISLSVHISTTAIMRFFLSIMIDLDWSDRGAQSIEETLENPDLSSETILER